MLNLVLFLSFSYLSSYKYFSLFFKPDMLYVFFPDGLDQAIWPVS